MRPGNPKLRYLYAVWAFLECLGFGGLLYGWGSLVYILKDEGLYLDLCDNTPTNGSAVLNVSEVTPYSVGPGLGNASVVIDSPAPVSVEGKSPSDGCDARDNKLALVFTIASAMFCVGCFIMGQINFKFGTRITRILAMILFISGALMIAFTTNDVPWLIFPGLSLIGSGGITYLMTNTQVSVLFQDQGSLIVGLLCGGFDASSGVQLMVKLGYENGISRQMSYIILAVSHLLTLVSTFFFLPKKFIVKPTLPAKRTADVAYDGEVAVELTSDKATSEESPEGPRQSLMSCIVSPIYILHVIWLSILQLRFYFLLGSLNKSLEDLLDNDKDAVSHYTNVSMYILMCGIFASPFAGFVYDFHNRFFKNSESVMRRTLMPAVIPLAITTTLCLIMSGLVLVEHPHAWYAVFVALVLFRSFLYTMGAGFINAIFPSEYFGILYGVLILTGGIISMFQYALFQWSEAAGSNQVNLFLLVLVLVTYGHPLFQWWTARRAERSGSLDKDKDDRLMSQ
ncbi:solute carrier family 43 member 3 [Aplysia californica]|uniref:Solute carrier family 43 member 3 n=1 Tax=Aplysia californica TaxID=6500 RepID=A0ABM0JVN1_APLCA|nr:solute carrier family 43 member 3 [Aplysia californica]